MQPSLIWLDLEGSRTPPALAHTVQISTPRQWEALLQGTPRPTTPPLLVGVGLGSHTHLRELALAWRTGGGLLLDENAGTSSLGDCVSLLTSAPRILCGTHAIRRSWLDLLAAQWDAEPEDPEQLAVGQSERAIVAAALQAREIAQASWKTLSEEPIELAWNRAHQAYGRLAATDPDPLRHNLAVNVALASSSFQPRWRHPQQARAAQIQLLQRTGCIATAEQAEALVQLVPPEPTPSSGAPPLSVHLHAYHLPEAGVILSRLAALPQQPSQLLITCSNPQQAATTLKCQLASFPGSQIELLQVANSGRNIGALMAVAGRLKHEAVLHLHSKDSSHPDPSSYIHRWLHYLVSTLCSQATALSSALHQGTAVAAFPLDPHRRQLGSNCAAVQELVEAHQNASGRDPQVHLQPRDALLFPMGMMLGLRRSFLRNHLLPLYQSINGNRLAEPLAVNATPLHGFERAIPLIAALEQQRVLLLQSPPGLSR